MSRWQVGGFVVCRTNSGFVVNTAGAREPHVTHFERNAVAQVRAVDGDDVRVYIIGARGEFVVKAKHLFALDPAKTGKGFPHKICNLCHVLKDHSKFETNQTDAKGGKTSRPSCRMCRQDIDRRHVAAKDKQAAEAMRPAKGTLWRCPICRKESIVGVTAKVVLDHDHGAGVARAFLCESCNTGLGRFRNGGNYLRNAIAYLEQHEQD